MKRSREHKQNSTFYCSHCGQTVQKRTFKQHARHWNKVENKWNNTQNSMPKILAHGPTPPEVIATWAPPPPQISRRILLPPCRMDSKQNVDREIRADDDVLTLDDSIGITHPGEPNVSTAHEASMQDDIEAQDINMEQKSPEIQRAETLLFNNVKMPPTVTLFLMFMRIFQDSHQISHNGMNALWHLITFFAPEFVTIVKHFKVTTHSNTTQRIDRLLGLTLKDNQSGFNVMVSCTKCHCQYAIKNVNMDKQHYCSYVQWPEHKTPKFREPCKNPLLRKSKTKQDDTWEPIMTYCYRKPTQQMKLLVQHPAFEQNLDHWKKRKPCRDVCSDIYESDEWTRQREWLMVCDYYLFFLNF